ncbi:MAG: alpha-hydroxy-acid oxidizing protein [Sulfitobacter sp.]|uniref:alpha-hydroxy-acid oxidizing protein n=1 Tax=Alphaproteobacteria TaxID=28211 RepID=UPI0032637D11
MVGSSAELNVLKALAIGAKAVGLGRAYLYALTAAGQPGIERMLTQLTAEITRDMRLMGVTRVADLTPDMLRFR